MLSFQEEQLVEVLTKLRELGFPIVKHVLNAILQNGPCRLSAGEIIETTNGVLEQERYENFGGDPDIDLATNIREAVRRTYSFGRAEAPEDHQFNKFQGAINNLKYLIKHSGDPCKGIYRDRRIFLPYGRKVSFLVDERLNEGEQLIVYPYIYKGGQLCVNYKKLSESQPV